MNKKVKICNKTHSAPFGYTGNEAKLLYEDDKFFVVELKTGKNVIFNKSQYYYEEIFVQPVSIGKYVTLSIKGDYDASCHGECNQVLAYEKRSGGYWVCINHTTFGASWYPLNGVDLVEIPRSIVDTFFK